MFHNIINILKPKKGKDAGANKKGAGTRIERYGMRGRGGGAVLPTFHLQHGGSWTLLIKQATPLTWTNRASLHTPLAPVLSSSG